MSNNESKCGVVSDFNRELGMISDKLVWNNWKEGRKVPDDVPVDELLLIDLGDGCNRRYKTAQFFMTANKEKFGCVGDVFWFDAKPIRWASIQHLVDA